MRELTKHKSNGGLSGQDLNDALTIRVLDEAGAGGACHKYFISSPPGNVTEAELVVEAGVNGVSQEALLAIVIDRLQGFQEGDFACIENGRALQHAQFALDWLHKRTNQRVARGVEGTSQQ